VIKITYVTSRASWAIRGLMEPPMLLAILKHKIKLYFLLIINLLSTFDVKQM